MARALAADPPVLLMDEPFGAVDPITRARLQQEFLPAAGTRCSKTIVFVTHDIDEAILLGDRIVLMAAGRVVRTARQPICCATRPTPSSPHSSGKTGGCAPCSSPHWPSSPLRPQLTYGRMVWFCLDPLDFWRRGRELGLHGDVAGEGFWIGDDAGQPTGYLTYQQFAVVLGETVGQPAWPPAKGRQMAYLRDNPDRVLS